MNLLRGQATTLSAEQGFVFRRLALAVAVAAAGCIVSLSVLGKSVEPLTAVLVLLLLTLVTSATFGFRAGLIVTIASNMALAYFFLKPIHVLWIADPEDWGAIPAFVIVSAVGGSLLHISQRLAEEAEQGRGQAEALLSLNRAINAQSEPQLALDVLCQEVVSTFSAEGAAVLQEGGDGWSVIASSGGEDAARPVSRPEALLAGKVTVAAEAMPSLEPASNSLVLPLAVGARSLGVLRLDLPRGGEGLSEHSSSLLTAFAGEAARTLSRMELTLAASQAETLRQADEMKTLILTSISHDLKTPLATIKASITSLKDDGVPWSTADRGAFLDTIDEEADRLNKMITDLLDLNRLEAGTVHAILAPQSLAYLVEEAMELASRVLGRRQVIVDVPEITVYADASLVRHAVANLLENAALYSRPEGCITVHGCSTENIASLIVEDEGPGIDSEYLPVIFNAFVKGHSDDSSRVGSGLGLAIVRGFVALSGGEVVVESTETQTRFVINLPVTA